MTRIRGDLEPMQIQIPYDPATNPLNNNEWSFPLLEIIHIDRKSVV